MATKPRSSRLPGFYKLKLAERVAAIAREHDLIAEETAVLSGERSLALETADQMVENAIGTLSLPLGLGLNLQVNNRDYLIPMAVEEPSVIAAVSHAARIVREGGGFVAEADPPVMIGQVQIVDYGDAVAASRALCARKDELLAHANSFHPEIVRLGGGARDIEVRILEAPEGPDAEPVLVLHVYVDVRDAMGANLVNTMVEGIAPLVENITGGKVFLRILSNLADRRLARSSCKIPLEVLADRDLSGMQVAQGIFQASRFALADPYRAATHNKGIMNGIDAMAIALGNDWRAIEAGAHAFAARDGRYRPLSTWTMQDGYLCGRIELPLAVGMVGGTMRVHPGVRLLHKLLNVSNACELATVMASVGLAQNMAALRALGTVGIQRGHMALHARAVAVEAGARGEQVERVASQMVKAGQIKIEKAKELLKNETAE